MRIPRLTDRFIIKLGEISVEVSPMSGREKIEYGSFTTYENGKLKVNRPAQDHYAVKSTVKAISGVSDFDGNAYQLQFDGNHLTDECADEVLGLLATTWFTVAFSQMASNEDGKVISPIDGKEIDGVSIKIVKPEKEDKEESAEKK